MVQTGKGSLCCQSVSCPVTMVAQASSTLQPASQQACLGERPIPPPLPGGLGPSLLPTTPPFQRYWTTVYPGKGVGAPCWHPSQILAPPCPSSPLPFPKQLV